MGNCWAGRVESELEDAGDRVRVSPAERHAKFASSSRSGTDSIPITPVKPTRASLVSNLGKSVSDRRTHEEEELFRNIVSATAKNFIDTSSVGMNTPMPASAVSEIRDAYMLKIQDMPVPDLDSIAAFDALPMKTHSANDPKFSRVTSVGLVSMIDASQREQASFFFPASSKMFQAHDSMLIHYVGDFIVAWDDASMAADSLEDAAMRPEYAEGQGGEISTFQSHPHIDFGVTRTPNVVRF